MNELVLDASVVLKWFGPADEVGVEAARALRDRYEHGDLLVAVPPLLFLEILNVAGHRWRWDDPSLQELAAALEGLGFEVERPPLDCVAAWVTKGLTAYDAAYVALAEHREARLVTSDLEILAVAGGVATELGSR